MTAVVRSTGALTTGATTAASFSPTMPAGFVAGDLLIGIACNGTGAVPSTRPSGSTALTNVVDGAVFNMDVVRKVAAGADVFTWTTAASIKWAGCVIAIMRGTYDPVTPTQGNLGVAQGTASTTFSAPSSTPGNADSLIIGAFGAQVAATWSTTNTAPTMTEIADVTGSGTAVVSMGAYRSNTPPALAAIVRSAISSISTGNGASFVLFVNPAPFTRLRRPRPQLRR